MLYTDLDKISLDTFIDVFTGDKSKLLSSKENILKKNCPNNRRSSLPNM